MAAWNTEKGVIMIIGMLYCFSHRYLCISSTRAYCSVEWGRIILNLLVVVQKEVYKVLYTIIHYIVIFLALLFIDLNSFRPLTLHLTSI